MKSFTYHQDPGHGWLEVSQADLGAAGLSWCDFSSCSYTNGRKLFLEEDCDMPKFLKAFEAKHGEFKLREVHSDPCFIRDLPSLPS